MTPLPAAPPEAPRLNHPTFGPSAPMLARATFLGASVRRGRPPRRGHANPQVLDHPARAAIVDLVRMEPGVSFLGIFERLRSCAGLASGVGNGSLVWHLARLERAGILSSRRSGRCRRYYTSAGPWHADLAACAFVQSTARWPLALALAQAPGLSLLELAAKLPPECERSSAGLRIQLALMREAGLVEAERRGRTLHYRASDRLRQIVAAIPAADIGAASESVAWPTNASAPADPAPVA